MCPKHIPSRHFIPPLHPSRVLKFISPYLPPLVNPLPYLHLAYLWAALLALWRSHHTLSIKLSEARALRSTQASHSPSLVPSVPVSLSHSLSHFRKGLGCQIYSAPPFPITHTHTQFQVRRQERDSAQLLIGCHLTYSLGCLGTRDGQFLLITKMDTCRRDQPKSSADVNKKQHVSTL